MIRSAVTIGFPYRHSTGPVVGRALAALRDGVILGGRCVRCGVVSVPAREWCERCGGGTTDLEPVGPGGTVTARARVHSSALLGSIQDPTAWALVRLDGAGTDLIHLVRGDVDPGARVRPVWRAERRGAITDIECFEGGEAPPHLAAAEHPGRVEVLERALSLPYTLSPARSSRASMRRSPPIVVSTACGAPTAGWSSFRLPPRARGAGPTRRAGCRSATAG